MKILITGAAGFIGGYLVERLTREHEVYALSRSVSAVQGSAHWIEQNLALPLQRDPLPAAIDVVIHLAQSRHFRKFPAQAVDIFDVNVRSTLELLDYAQQAGAEQFIYASSGGVYTPQDHDLTETDPVSPSNFYLTSKYASELLVDSYQPFFHTLVCRLFFVYGARQSPNMLIPRLVRSVYDGQPIVLQGRDGIRINPTYVADVVEVLSQSLRLEGHHLVNIAGSQALSMRQIADTIGAAIGREPVFDVHLDQPPNDLVADITRLKTLLHIQPKTPFADGVIEVCTELAQ
jgi:UDP-glucose 4-epimerase